ncbi:MAG: hypothetical protein EZS28_002443 [Streblomastix strix]|uniref:DNA-directed DNA polymerase n=1 Tax=Streblomastix strix TaxID=222440 RepID=A0A5J4X458_9EUKA|nr:MAG: hypothetical protein EZS28_002443 [Streblomastix strix]
MLITTQKTTVKNMNFIQKKWCQKVESYIQQDNKAGRDTTNNVTADDIDWANELNPNKCCYCQAKFTNVNMPTHERIDNNIAHTKYNCKLAYQLCNSSRSNKDADVAKLMIQMYKYAIAKNLPMTIDDEEVYWFLRNSIHGGLSQVFHQYNFKVLTHINKLRYNPEDKNLTAYDQDYIITHILDLDFNSLYPCAFCGIYNKNNPYNGYKMYMPGRVTMHIKIREANDQVYRETKRKEMMNIINSEDRFSEEKGQLFIASVKGHIDKNHINEHFNFPPIWRKRTYKTDKKTVGKFTYEKMQKQGMSANKLETKLTSLLSNHDEFMSFSSYYLWLLIDYCHFIIDDVEEIVLFTKHTAFKSFVEVMTEKRQQAMREGNQAKQLYFKNIMNSSNGADGQNNEKFDKIGIFNKQQTYLKQLNKSFTNTRKICEDRYIVSINPDSFSAHKCLQESIFTQDNSKFWFLCFIYFFLCKCIDTDRVQFCCMNTDSMYQAISGSTIEGYKQQFKYEIKDQEFWENHYKEWLPWEGCSIAEETKLLGCAIELWRESIICLAPKCYSAIDGEVDDVIRMKDVNEKNSVLTTESTIPLCYVNGDPVKKHQIPYSSKNYCTSFPLNDLSSSPLILVTYYQFISFFSAVIN